MANSKPTIAVTGANGFLGSRLVDYFSQQGWKVIGLVRNPPAAARSAKITYRRYDMNAPLEKVALQGVDYLVHAAYIKFDKSHPDAFQTNLQAAKNLVTGARSQGVQRTIFISTMSAHSEAISVYGKQKLAIEKLFTGDNNTVLKPGLIIGDGGIVREMADFMRSKHAVPLIGGGRQPLQIIAVDDLVRVIEAVFKNGFNGTYITATPQVYTYKQFYQALAKRLHTRVVYLPVPYIVLQSIFRLAGLLHIPLGVGEDNLLGLKKLKAMDSTADLQRLGVSLQSLDEALEATDL